MKINLRRYLLFLLLVILSSSVNAQIKIVPDGNVGIGTVNPQAKLDIHGRLHMERQNRFLWAMPMDPSLFMTRGSKYADWPGIIGSSTGGIAFWDYAKGFNYVWARKYWKPSDEDLKSEIELIRSPLEELEKINGYTYTMSFGDNMENRYKEMGFLAQEVEKAFPYLVSEAGEIKTMDYDAIIPLTVEGIKALKSMYAQLDQRISELESRLTDCCQRSSTRKKGGYNTENSLNDKPAKLYQNTPNPFSENTAIRFDLPRTFSGASVIIFNMSGVLIKEYPIDQAGQQEIIVEGASLASGMYLYSLVVDGVEIDTKRMILR